jgi:hypothetical protein
MNMSTAPKNSKWRKGLLWVIFLIMLGIFLQHIPGTYTIDDFQDDYELTSPEGIALLALSDASLSAELYFKTAKRHRISRHAEILVPDDTRLWVSAETVPYVQDNEVILKPSALTIHASRPLTFIYRYVTVARAKTLYVDPEAAEAKVKAIGHYRVLSALATAYRYKRQKAVKRDYKIPDFARVDFQANFLPDHELKTIEGFSLSTGSEPGRLWLQDAVWRDQRWEQGTLQLFLPFSDLHPLINQLLSTVIPEKIELGDVVDLRLDRIHHLKFTENFLDLHVEGRVAYAKSKAVTNMFYPSFKSHLGIQFQFPEQVPLEDAEASVELKNIYSLDFNRSHPLFDKMVRNLARDYRKDARAGFNVKNEFPGIIDLPGQLFIDHLKIQGDENGFPQLDMRLHLRP